MGSKFKFNAESKNLSGKPRAVEKEKHKKRGNA